MENRKDNYTWDKEENMPEVSIKNIGHLIMEKKKYIYRRDKEGDPAHHDKHGGGEVDGEDEGAQRPAQQNLKPVRTVVACISLDISTPSIKTPSQPT